MFGLSSVRYRSFSVRVNFRSIISGLSSGRISVHSVRVSFSCARSLALSKRNRTFSTGGPCQIPALIFFLVFC